MNKKAIYNLKYEKRKKMKDCAKVWNQSLALNNHVSNFNCFKEIVVKASIPIIFLAVFLQSKKETFYLQFLFSERKICSV